MSMNCVNKYQVQIAGYNHLNHSVIGEIASDKSVKSFSIIGEIIVTFET